jgi:hypothetical protein
MPSGVVARRSRVRTGDEKPGMASLLFGGLTFARIGVRSAWSVADKVRSWISPRSGGGKLAVGLSPRKGYRGNLRRVATLEMVGEI